MATLQALQSFHGVRDLYLMLEVMTANARTQNAQAEKAHG